MSRFPEALALSLLIAGPVLAQDGFGLGREALPEEIAAWDVNVMPDGDGLPEGSGDVLTGEETYLEYCASCHGDFAEGLGNWPKLSGGEGTLDNKDPVKTVGSYWPYLSTLWDYVHRSMPFGQAQILTPDETYGIVAYILYSNYLVEEDFVLSKENFLDVALPNAEGFFEDNRAEVEYERFTTEPCMENCRDSVRITRRATNLNVTPGDSSDDAAPEPDETAAADSPVEPVADAPAEPAPETSTAAPAEDDASDPELIAAGEKVFAKCKACHMVGEDAKNRVGPVLNGVIGRTAGTYEGYKYSQAMVEAGESGIIWTTDELTQYLQNPKALIPGTKMNFAGLKKDEDIRALEAFLATHP